MRCNNSSNITDSGASNSPFQITATVGCAANIDFHSCKVKCGKKVDCGRDGRPKCSRNAVSAARRDVEGRRAESRLCNMLPWNVQSWQTVCGLTDATLSNMYNITSWIPSPLWWATRSSVLVLTGCERVFSALRWASRTSHCFTAVNMLNSEHMAFVFARVFLSACINTVCLNVATLTSLDGQQLPPALLCVW